jgi:hypothetical protein
MNSFQPNGPEQDQPVEDMHEITDEGRLQGLLAQIRSDAHGTDAESVERHLRDRLADTGIDLSDEDVSRYATEIAGG